MDDASYTPDLAELVEQHYALLYRYAFRLSGASADAEDFTQQTFLIARMKLDQLRDAGSAKSWLCAILRNVYLKSRRRPNGAALISMERAPEPAQDAEIETLPDQEELQKVLGELPEEFRTPLILFYFEEFSYKEIARQMETPIGTVMSRLARAKAYLRRRLSVAEPAASRF